MTTEGKDGKAEKGMIIRIIVNEICPYLQSAHILTENNRGSKEKEEEQSRQMRIIIIIIIISKLGGKNLKCLKHILKGVVPHKDHFFVGFWKILLLLFTRTYRE